MANTINELRTAEPADIVQTAPAMKVTSRVPDQRVLHAINPFMVALLRSPVHGILSNRMLLLTYTGRRSGRRFTLPVGYARDGGDLLVISQQSEHKRWWRNMRGGAPVILHLRGHPVNARAEVIESPVEVATTIMRLVDRLGAEQASRLLYMDLDTMPPVTAERLASALVGVLLVRLTLDAPAASASKEVVRRRL